MQKITSQTQQVVEQLISFWQFHRGFDANISDLSNYVDVSRDTVYRWLNRKCPPKEKKLKLIAEWLEKQRKVLERTDNTSNNQP